ncbi:MAG: hypothetical protein GDA56_29570 [Hormoscilla sp. GM7CHS1pb]|nr:hypothetical protein [Hormoscilla sp. GM7CHS1pb]
MIRRAKILISSAGHAPGAWGYEQYSTGGAGWTTSKVKTACNCWLGQQILVKLNIYGNQELSSGEPGF